MKCPHTLLATAAAVVVCAAAQAAPLDAAHLFGDMFFNRSPPERISPSTFGSFALADPGLGTLSILAAGTPFPLLVADAEIGPDPLPLAFGRASMSLFYGIEIDQRRGTVGNEPPAGPTSTVVQEVTCNATCQQRVNQILASAEIILAHDHLRDAPHLTSARTGHVTAMTVELTVDQMKWVNVADVSQHPPDPFPDPTKCQMETDGVQSCVSAANCPHSTDTCFAGRCLLHCNTSADCQTGHTCFGGVCLIQHEETTCCGHPQAYDCFLNVYSERSWFDIARNDLLNNVSQLGGQVRIVDTVQKIDSAKADGVLGVVIGTEGADVTCTTLNDCPLDAPNGVPVGTGSLANAEALYQLGWRKAQLRHGSANAFTKDLHLTYLGKQFVATLNRLGVVVDTMHLASLPGSKLEIDEVLEVSNAPVLVSHQWQRGMSLTTSDEYLVKQANSGGGHGVIALNALGSYYTSAYESGDNTIPADCLPRGYSNAEGNTPATLQNFLDRLYCLQKKVGIDHVAIGPDFMPGGESKYAIGGGGEATDLSTIPDLVTALVLDPANYKDEEIKKILGANLRDLYQRVWDPTNGNTGGQAHFQLCADDLKAAGTFDPVCVAAASNNGQGDLLHRAVSCGHYSNQQPVGLQISYASGHWQFRDLNNTLQNCFAGSTLVVSVADASAPWNAKFGVDGVSCDPSCQLARANAGAGTQAARALNCTSTAAPGIIGLQLAYTNAWGYYDAFAQLRSCRQTAPTPGTWVVSWGATVPPSQRNAYVRLCDDRSSDPAGTGPQVCKDAAQNNGAGITQGTNWARALSCLNSSVMDPNGSGIGYGFAPTGFGVVALDVYYSTDPYTGKGRWFFLDQASQPHRCVHGSVLVASNHP